MINLLNEYELAFGVLPNEPDSNQVIYLENHQNIKLEWYIKGHLSELKKLFRTRGLEFIYLPELVDCIDDDDLINAARYYVPWLKTTDLQALRDSCKISIEQLYQKVNLKDDVPAVVNGNGRAFKVDVRRERDLGALFYQIAEAYGRSNNDKYSDNEVRYSVVDDIPYLRPIPQSDVESCIAKEKRTTSILDDEYAEADRLYEQLKQTHPSWALEAILASQLRMDEVVSRIVINSPRRLLLPDYNNLEIRLTPAAMAFYLLYLKHPEGIRFKELIDHRQEMLRMYNYTTKSSDKKTINDTVDALVAQLDGSQDVQRSRIKESIQRTFKAHMCEKYAKMYYINGRRDEPMKIEIPQDKIIWEVDL